MASVLVELGNGERSYSDLMSKKLRKTIPILSFFCVFCYKM